MATYNLAKSKKDLSDTHTQMRLKEQHEKAPEVVTEKQLDKKDHEGETDVTTEKQLDKVRVGGADKIIEKNISDSKGMFGSKHRNPDASKGDINKLEEKRLSGKKTEDEKYSASSETPKQLRWWDGLKKAKTETTIKTAQFDPEDRGEEGHEFDPAASFSRLREMTGDDPEADEGLLPDSDVSRDIGGEVEELEDAEAHKAYYKDAPHKMFISKNKEGAAPLPHINMELRFDPEDFGDDEEAIKQAALEKVLEVRPNLAGKIDTDNFSQVLHGDIDASVRLLLVGDEYFAPSEEEGSGLFQKIDKDQVDVGGTPVTVGKIKLGPEAEAMDKETLLKSLVDYIADKLKVNIPEDAISVNLEKGEATFAFDAQGSAVTSSPEDETEGVEEPLDIPQEGEGEGEDLFDVGDEELLEDPLTEAPGATGDELAGGPEEFDVTEEEEPKPLPIPPEEPKPVTPTTPTTAKSIYDFPIVIADLKDSKKKVDNTRVDKALKEFWDGFDPDNLTAANQEITSLINAAQFSDPERVRFMSDIRKKLNTRNISLDALKSFV